MFGFRRTPRRRRYLLMEGGGGGGGRSEKAKKQVEEVDSLLERVVKEFERDKELVELRERLAKRDAKLGVSMREAAGAHKPRQPAPEQPRAEELAAERTKEAAGRDILGETQPSDTAWAENKWGRVRGLARGKLIELASQNAGKNLEGEVVKRMFIRNLLDGLAGADPEKLDPRRENEIISEALRMTIAWKIKKK
jgi:hypothetical protein